ncbi:MAG: oxidoreductase [Acidimicrobiia bacterium]|nr:oxidoreductase [Acidimicrobiia bacterium]MDH5236004.1 oxidoreductase [Acidimicrobiia bacterium]
MADWTEADIPDQTGRNVLITGANTGIGFEAARALAQHGARVLLGCRNPEKAADAVERLAAAAPGAMVEVVPIDVSSLSSVREAAAVVRADTDQIHLLINNAGIMMTPRWQSDDGHEMQFATNHLGHFALTGQLIDLVMAADGGRVVSVSSNAHKFGKMNFEDLDAEKKYRRTGQYGMTKLANLLFIRELQRRLAAADTDAIALACHPGGSATELSRNLPTLLQKLEPVTAVFTQSAAMGALPTLRAATDPAATGGQYYGPGGFGEMKGHPVVRQPTKAACRDADATRLWEISEELTGVSWPI